MRSGLIAAVHPRRKYGGFWWVAQANGEAYTLAILGGNLQIFLDFTPSLAPIRDSPEFLPQFVRSVGIVANRRAVRDLQQKETR
jgi:hypothetical protein